MRGIPIGQKYRGKASTIGGQNEAIKSLCSSVRRFRDATIETERKSDYPHALQALWKALDRAEDLRK
jgi:hypothetical protein